MGFLYFYISNGYALQFTHISTFIDIVTHSGGVIIWYWQWTGICVLRTLPACVRWGEGGGLHSSSKARWYQVPVTAFTMRINWLNTAKLHSWLHSVHFHQMLLTHHTCLLPPFPPSPQRKQRRTYFSTSCFKLQYLGNINLMWNKILSFHW